MHRRDTTLFAFRGWSVNIRSLGQATKQYFGKSRHCCHINNPLYNQTNWVACETAVSQSRKLNDAAGFPQRGTRSDHAWRHRLSILPWHRMSSQRARNTPHLISLSCTLENFKFNSYN
jgi:hypothetical protein